MNSAPATDQSNKSASHYNTADDALKNMILDLVRINDNWIPCSKILDQLKHDGFTQAKVMKALDSLAQQGHIAFESRAYHCKPFSHVKLIVVGAAL